MALPNTVSIEGRMSVEWTTESLRLSLFSTENFQGVDDIWHALVGNEEPETRRNVGGRRMASGSFQGGVLQLATFGSRLDCILQPKAPDPDSEGPLIPKIGPWLKSLEQFVASTSAWLSTLRAPITRIAFGGALFTKVDDLRSAYLLLSQLLQNVKIDPDRTRDLIYRANYSVTSSAVDGLVLNRITTWTAVQVSVQFFQDLGVSTITSEAPGATLTRVEFDYNTEDGRTEQLPADQLVPIYKELASLAFENAEKGEVS